MAAGLYWRRTKETLNWALQSQILMLRQMGTKIIYASDKSLDMALAYSLTVLSWPPYDIQKYIHGVEHSMLPLKTALRPARLSKASAANVKRNWSTEDKTSTWNNLRWLHECFYHRREDNKSSPCNNEILQALPPELVSRLHPNKHRASCQVR